ncbi:replication protein A [Sphingomonas sp.]|uniref:replication protein A n=1 Tax=Sphingomonas sp. TaxID=28214 RepID=UPI0028AC01C8|nr:replication protein A [Sphingomonas sp.]
MARSIGDLAATILHSPGTQKSNRRTGQPVRRNSYAVGERERRLWRPIADGKCRNARRWIGAVMRAARRFERESMEAGKRNGALGHIGLEVLEELFRLVDYRTGRLDPAVATIAANIRRSYKAVHAALKRLAAAGFLEWIRRTEQTDNEGEFGPQVRQISNAYGFRLPKRVAKMVRQILGNAPPPQDALWRRDEHAAETNAMLLSVSAVEAFDASIDVDGELGTALRNLAQAVDNANFLEGENPGAKG